MLAHRRHPKGSPEKDPREVEEGVRRGSDDGLWQSRYDKKGKEYRWFKVQGDHKLTTKNESPSHAFHRWKLESNQMLVCDPGFPKKIKSKYTDFGTTLKNCKQGEWITAVFSDKKGGKPDALLTWFVNHDPSEAEWKKEGEVVSDSLQVGVYDPKKYPNGESTGDMSDPKSFFGVQNNLTVHHPYWGVSRYGAVIGCHGSGKVNVYVSREDGRVVGVLIKIVMDKSE